MKVAAHMEINIITSELSRIPRRLSVSDNNMLRKKAAPLPNTCIEESPIQPESGLSIMKYDDLQKLANKLGKVIYKVVS